MRILCLEAAKAIGRPGATHRRYVPTPPPHLPRSLGHLNECGFLGAGYQETKARNHICLHAVGQRLPESALSQGLEGAEDRPSRLGIQPDQVAPPCLVTVLLAEIGVSGLPRTCISRWALGACLLQV